MAAGALSFPSPLPLQVLRKQIMENNRYKWLLHHTTWWMQLGLPASHPFLFSILSHSVYSLLSPLSPAVYVSVWKQGRTWALSHPTTLSLYGCIICLAFLALTLYSHWHCIGQGSFSKPFFLFLSSLLSFSLLRLLSPLAHTSPLSPRACCTPRLQSKRLGLSKANSQHPVL